MVFRNGGRPAEDEFRTCKTQQIKVVAEYKYLGMISSLQKHNNKEVQIFAKYQASIQFRFGELAV